MKRHRPYKYPNHRLGYFFIQFLLKTVADCSTLTLYRFLYDFLTTYRTIIINALSRFINHSQKSHRECIGCSQEYITTLGSHFAYFGTSIVFSFKKGSIAWKKSGSKFIGKYNNTVLAVRIWLIIFIGGLPIEHGKICFIIFLYFFLVVSLSNIFNWC